MERIFALAVDRWVGVEGVMVASSYPDKSAELFLRALTEHSKSDESSLYQKMSNSVYQDSDMSKYRFASLPGAVAFFYFSGSLWLVLFGMCGLVLLMLFAEQLTHYLTGNELLCALFGMNAANAVAQLGVAPRQLLIHFGMIVTAIIFVWIIQIKRSDSISRILP